MAAYELRLPPQRRPVENGAVAHVLADTLRRVYGLEVQVRVVLPDEIAPVAVVAPGPPAPVACINPRHYSGMHSGYDGNCSEGA